MLGQTELTQPQLDSIPLRHLAHLGDAVFHLFERERALLAASSARQLHDKARVSAIEQAQLLDQLKAHLTISEETIVKRACNLKPSGYRKVGQNAYRKATAFEALLGYLYLSNQERLLYLLQRTLPEKAPDSLSLKESSGNP